MPSRSSAEIGDDGGWQHWRCVFTPLQVMIDDGGRGWVDGDEQGLAGGCPSRSGGDGDGSGGVLSVVMDAGRVDGGLVLGGFLVMGGR
ncbi:hypothetical protein Dimus_031756 [Dionaea muscipula]